MTEQKTQSARQTVEYSIRRCCVSLAAFEQHANKSWCVACPVPLAKGKTGQGRNSAKRRPPRFTVSHLFPQPHARLTFRPASGNKNRVPSPRFDARGTGVTSVPVGSARNMRTSPSRSDFYPAICALGELAVEVFSVRFTMKRQAGRIQAQILPVARDDHPIYTYISASFPVI